MLAEIAKMEDLRHPNVMSLIGVHLDVRSGLSIVMPFMASGSLLEYLKRERNAIYLDDSADVDTVGEHASYSTVQPEILAGIKFGSSVQDRHICIP